MNTKQAGTSNLEGTRTEVPYAFPNNNSHQYQNVGFDFAPTLYRITDS